MYLYAYPVMFFICKDCSGTVEIAVNVHKPLFTRFAEMNNVGKGVIIPNYPK